MSLVLFNFGPFRDFGPLKETLVILGLLIFRDFRIFPLPYLGHHRVREREKREKIFTYKEDEPSFFTLLSIREIRVTRVTCTKTFLRN